jgi:hypothetical protein
LIMSAVTDPITDIVGGITGSDQAAEAATAGAETAAASQREALEYLKEREAQPQFYREQALGQLASFYGLPQYASTASSQEYDDYSRQIADLESQIALEGTGKWNDDRGHFTNLRAQLAEAQRQQGLLDYDPTAAPTQAADPGGQLAFIEGVKESPFYQQNLLAGEQAIGRGASMTGGLRSGTANEALAQNNQQVLQNLVNQRLQGISGLAQTQSYAPQIAQGISGIGQTLGQGQIAAGQAYQDSMSGLMQAGGQLGGAYLGSMSDVRLKENVTKIGEVDGHNWYSWTWNQKAADLGLEGDSEGVIAQEVQKTNPEYVAVNNGYLAVNYDGLFGESH